MVVWDETIIEDRSTKQKSYKSANFKEKLLPSC